MKAATKSIIKNESGDIGADHIMDISKKTQDTLTSLFWKEERL